MSRPKDADSERTMSSIIEAALDMMAEQQSVAAPSLRSVAARAGIGTGTIQYYFDSKEELLEACLDGHYDRLQELWASRNHGFDHGHEGSALIQQASETLYDFCYRERGLLRLRVVTNVQRGELHPRRQEYFLGSLSAQIAKVLEPHIQVDALDARCSVQAIAALFVRFACLSDSELEQLIGEAGVRGRAEARAYAIRAARRLLRPLDG